MLRIQVSGLEHGGLVPLVLQNKRQLNYVVDFLSTVKNIPTMAIQLTNPRPLRCSDVGCLVYDVGCLVYDVECFVYDMECLVYVVGCVDGRDLARKSSHVLDVGMEQQHLGTTN